MYLDFRKLRFLEGALQNYKNLTEVNRLGEGKVKAEIFVGTALVRPLSPLTEVTH